MKILNMKSVQDKPTLMAIPDLPEIWTESRETRKRALTAVCEAVVNKFVKFQFHMNSTSVHEEDMINVYATQIISIGCFYFEFSDRIREGHSERVLRCWRYLLPMFHSSGIKNYTLEALNMLCIYLHLDNLLSLF